MLRFSRLWRFFGARSRSTRDVMALRSAYLPRTSWASGCCRPAAQCPFGNIEGRPAARHPTAAWCGPAGGTEWLHPNRWHPARPALMRCQTTWSPSTRFQRCGVMQQVHLLAEIDTRGSILITLTEQSSGGRIAVISKIARHRNEVGHPWANLQSFNRPESPTIV